MFLTTLNIGKKKNTYNEKLWYHEGLNWHMTLYGMVPTRPLALTNVTLRTPKRECYIRKTTCSTSAFIHRKIHSYSDTRKMVKPLIVFLLLLSYSVKMVSYVTQVREEWFVCMYMYVWLRPWLGRRDWWQWCYYYSSVQMATAKLVTSNWY